MTGGAGGFPRLFPEADDLRQAAGELLGGNMARAAPSC